MGKSESEREKEHKAVKNTIFKRPGSLFLNTSCTYWILLHVVLPKQKYRLNYYKIQVFFYQCTAFNNNIQGFSSFSFFVVVVVILWGAPTDSGQVRGGCRSCHGRGGEWRSRFTIGKFLRSLFFWRIPPRRACFFHSFLYSNVFLSFSVFFIYFMSAGFWPEGGGTSARLIPRWERAVPAWWYGRVVGRQGGREGGEGGSGGRGWPTELSIIWRRVRREERAWCTNTIQTETLTGGGWRINHMNPSNSGVNVLQKRQTYKLTTCRS